jgi:secreted trypsin-like serine protease
MKTLFIILISTMCSVALWAQSYSPVDSGVQPKIIGGIDSQEDYPWMVSIQMGGHFCGGALIGKDWVLTAAHCMENVNASELTLYIGGNSLSNLTGAEQNKVDWFVVHPDYNPNNFYSDIALIKLSQSSNKAPVALLSATANDGLAANEQVRVIGWGLTDASDGSSVSRTLQEVDLSFQPDSVCRDAYFTGIDNYWQRSLCAGEIVGGKDACQGDSGGPLLVKAGNDWALTGLVSWGDGCAEPEKYGAYTEVAFFQKWIEQRRRGVTLFGPEKIGFVGKGRSKSQTYSLLNLSNTPSFVTDKRIQPSANENVTSFLIDENNWRALNNGIPPGYQCEFKVNALGERSGEHDAVLYIDLDGYTIEQNLNAKVLNALSNSTALDNQWTWFSGTNNTSEHSTPWGTVVDATGVNGSVMRSGNISASERSLVLSYINGSGSSEPHYLKFDYKIDSTAGFLLLYVNENDESRQRFSDTGAASADAQWRTGLVPLPLDINHLLFLYFRTDMTSTSENKAFLDNLRICSDVVNDPNEATCTSAAAFYNQDELAIQDDPAPQDDWTHVCKKVSYLDSDINYASRTLADVVLAGANNNSGGSVYYLLGLIFLLARRKLRAAA